MSSGQGSQNLQSLPIGMFDSGIGGLTVLHQCLVTMPNEDFVYFGDTARFPYGEKSQEQLQEYATQVAAFLERVGVKLLVAACYSATAAALPTLQERFATPILGVVMPGARAAVQTSRYRRIGVLATEATVASGSYPRAIASLDIGAEVHQRACPGLASFIQDGDVASHEVMDAVRACTAPLKERRTDVVIMGCTHYPLISSMLQRFLGPDVALVDPAAEIAREVTEILRRQGIERREDREGEYSFYCTGDPGSFRSVGSRFLQLPIDEVRRVSLADLERLVDGESHAAAIP